MSNLKLLRIPKSIENLEEHFSIEVDNLNREIGKLKQNIDFIVDEIYLYIHSIETQIENNDNLSDLLDSYPISQYVEIEKSEELEKIIFLCKEAQIPIN